MAVCEAVGSFAAAAVATAPAPTQSQQDDALLDDVASAAVQQRLSQVAQQAVMFGAAPAARTFERLEQRWRVEGTLTPPCLLCMETH